ncbi:MAG TPA: phosphatidate cytidylyltransferase [Caulobacteraceae bacterium]|jgi:phosphatidate cytidylyltransferase|nr:phosphatidate cytidylyltransferase [Caulobacteraceae bacterium]
MTSLPRARGFDWNNLGVRVVSGLILALAALAAVWVFDWPGAQWRIPFFLLVAGAGAMLSLEWAAMAAPRAAMRAGGATAVAVMVVVLLAFLHQYWLAWGCVLLGALSSGLAARGFAARAVDVAYGVLYIAPAGIVIMWLRQIHQGFGWTLMLFATTWAADIAAFAVGNVVKGPKLWPRFSPNKTWSGLIGGLVAAAAVGLAAGYFMHLSLAGAALIGLTGGLATMAGDLWESVLKRRFGVKDSGDIIPGHGGLLDRVDGLMFAVMVFGLARLVVLYGWAH